MSQTSGLTGIFPPMITPFTDTGELYENGIRTVVDFLIEKGVNGLFACGSYGAFALMTDAERKRVAEIIFDQVNGRVPIIVQIGAGGTDRVIALGKHADSLGAKALAVVVPYYYSGFAYRDANILDHFEAITNAVRSPVYLYNNPKTTGFRVSVDLLASLADIGVAGMKDSSGDAMLFGEYINEVRPKHPDFNFMIGTTGLLLPAFSYGARSCVAGTANVFPELIMELYEKLETGQHEGADLQLKVLRVRALQGTEGFRPSACYSILRMQGIDAGVCRRPWRELSPGSYKEVERELTEMGLLREWTS